MSHKYRIEGVKYNPENWASLAPTERAACARFAAQRERELNTIEAAEWTATGGPFHGAKLSIDTNTNRTAPMAVGAWAGHYEVMSDADHLPAWNRKNADTTKRLQWVGNDGGQTINTHGTTATTKAAPEVTQKGFDQLRDLLADLAEDPTQRAEHITRQAPAYTYSTGRVDDYGTHIEGLNTQRGSWDVSQDVETMRTARGHYTRRKVIRIAPTPATGCQAPDDFGTLFNVAHTHTEAARYTIATPRARYTIGRTTYTVHATPEGVQRLKSAIIKAKRWFSDKLLSAATTPAQEATTATPSATIAAALAIGAAQASAAQATTENPEASACAELATVDAPDHSDTTSATPAADTPHPMADAVAQSDTPTPEAASPAPNHASDYTGALKTQAQASDYTNPLKTYSTGQAKTIPGSPWERESGTRDHWANIACGREKAADFFADIMDAMAQAKTEGLFYNSDTYPMCAAIMAEKGYQDATEKTAPDGVTNAFGSHCYLANDALRSTAKAAHQAESLAALNPHPGQALGTLVFSDKKRTTGVTITSVGTDGHIQFTGKRGTSTVAGSGTAANIRVAMDKAKALGQRKTSFDEFTSAAQATATPDASATPATDTPHPTADAVAQADTPTPEAASPAPDHASDYTAALKTLAQASDYTDPLKTPATGSAEPSSSATRENAQKVTSKNGQWVATLYKTWDNLHGLMFQALDGPELHSAHDSHSARMRALQGMARGEWAPAIGETYTGDTAAAAETANQRGDGYEYRASRNDHTLLERRPKLPTTTPAAPDFRALKDYPENLQGEALAQWFATATSSPQAAEYWGDALDHINGRRLIETRNALRVLGWDAKPYTWPLTLHGAALRVDSWTVNHGCNMARNTWTNDNGNQWADDWTMTPETLAAYVHAMAHPGPDAPTPSDTTPPETTAPNCTQAPETQAATAPANPAPRASKPKAERPWPQRNFKPTGAERIADESGAMAWECFIHQPRADRWAVLAYAGKASKPAHHYGYATEAAARDFVRRFAEQIEARQQAKQQHDAERRAKLAQPHGLTVGAVLVSSWGYEQTNVDFYEVTNVIGARTVEVREIAAEAVNTGDMTGRCIPVPGRYTSEPVRRLVGANGYVNVRQARFGHACELKPQIVAGVKVYPSQSWTSYA
jgi:hypothetical protein